MNTLLNYLKQPSTWTGIIAIITGFGLIISPPLSVAIAAAGVAAAGVVQVIRNEKKEDVK